MSGDEDNHTPGQTSPKTRQLEGAFGLGSRRAPPQFDARPGFCYPAPCRTAHGPATLPLKPPLDKAMKRTTIQSLLAAELCAAALSASAQGIGSGSLFSRVDDQATKVTQAYAALYEGFYGVDKARTLLKAALDVRPDGTPNITLNRAAGMAQFTIRLSVDEAAYDAWKADAHKRIEAVGMSVRFSVFEDTEARVIGGRFYRLGDNEEAALRRWEGSDKVPEKADLAVRAELVDATGKAMRTVVLPIEKFRRLGSNAYPIPLHHLNRLRDLPLDPNARIEGASEKAVRRALEKAEKNLDESWRSKSYEWGEVEDAYALFTLAGLTDEDMNAVADVRCVVFDYDRAGMAAADILGNMVQIPGKNCKMAKYEVTQAQWKAVMGDHSSRFEDPDNPVEGVSWDECQAFLKKLNARPVVKQSGLVFRLPTEGEWELACRAGATGDYCLLADGTEITKDTLGQVAWFEGNADYKTHPVGQKKPNAFGLYDMHGNVEEWTSTADGEYRVYRGGSRSDSARGCESSSRSRGWPSNRGDNVGFRLCASGEGKAVPTAVDPAVVEGIIASMVPIPGKDYRMGKFQVTQAQWEAVRGDNPSRFKGAENPVEQVSWYDCQVFLKRLNELPSVKQTGMTFRLPTEEEWELACRAGATGDYCLLDGGTEITDSTLGQVAWFEDNADQKTHPVGQKQPNAFGLYDMHGNVWEWTSTSVRENRVGCGGSCVNSAEGCESSGRGVASPSSRYDNLGFRLCASGGAD